MIENFNEEAQMVLINAKKEMLGMNHPYVGTEHLVLSILNMNTELSKRLLGYGISYNRFYQEIIKIIGKGTKKSEVILYTPLLKKIIENAILDSKENNDGEVTTEHLFSSLLEEGEGIAIRIFIGMNIDVEKLYDDFTGRIIKKNRKNKKLLIEDLGTNLTLKAENNELDPAFGREKEIKRVIEILSRRTKNNPILIGLAGVGKTAIVEELSRMISEGKVPERLQHKKIISLDMATTVAGTKYRGEFENRMKKILKEIEDNNDIILFIDEIHTLVGAGGAEGAIDASNIIKPALARGKIRCIGATTLDEYKQYIEKDSALERRFQKVLVKELNVEQTEDILLKIKPIYQKFHNVEIEDEIIKKIISLSDKYIYDRCQPDKSIDVLDEVCAKVSISEDKTKSDFTILNNKLKEVSKLKTELILENMIDEAYKYRKEEVKLKSQLNNITYKKQEFTKNVTLNDVAEVINEKTNIPIYEVLEKDTDTILNIETSLKKTIIGQDKAIGELINITRKIKLGYKNNKCYSFAFLGPSGVGKTMTTKMYAKYLVGDNNLIRLDMSEFSDSTSVNKIIGSAPGYIGYDDNHNVLEQVRNNPYSIILLDEIDKACDKVLNLFYQVLDEGKIKDSKGNVIKFHNCIIIMTSNVGYEKNKVGFTKSKKIDDLKKEFNLSFLNRIDNIIYFNHLTRDNIISIIDKEIEKLKNKYNDCKIIIDNKIKENIVNKSNYLEFGARKISKIFYNEIENIIVNNIINGNKEIYIDEIEKVSS